jgi:flagellar biosynthesis/type III secretory pathway M-ring protein FliF/YscJ
MHEPAALVEPGAFAPIGNAFKESAELLANSVAALIYAAVALLPWLLVAFVAWKVFRAVRRRRAKKAEEPARAA